MKISKEKMVVLIAEAISETIGLDHSNRGREEPLGKTGPVVEEEEKEMTEEEFMDWLHDMIERPGADPDYSRAMTFLGNLLDFKEVLDFWNINSKEELKNVIGNYMSMQENSDLMKEYEQEEYYKTVNGVTYRCVRNDEGDEDCYPLGGGKRRRYEEVKQAVREALKEEQDKGNPWAICTASVGRDDKAKYERCVQDVKKETGYKDESIKENQASEMPQVGQEWEPEGGSRRGMRGGKVVAVDNDTVTLSNAGQTWKLPMDKFLYRYWNTGK